MTDQTSDRIVQLYCACQNYDWGKQGSNSLAAKFAEATATNTQLLSNAAADARDFKIDETKPYAELWMGTHPSAPSKCVSSGTTLSELLEKRPELLGAARNAGMGPGQLPFLFKILSIEKILSIQAHPDKKLAEQLHAKDLKNYKDANHKPEMAIALTNFRGLCGFRPVAEIRCFLKTVKPLRELVGDDVAESFDKAKPQNHESALKLLFTALMTQDSAVVQSCAQKLMELLDELEIHSDTKNLIRSLNEQFPNDLGLFCIFILNVVDLREGEAIFLEANLPHAYISGDIIECMASSDNVVRAAFTPKFKDVENLVTMLKYDAADAEEQKMKVQQFPRSSGDGKCTFFNPPIDEFSLLRCDLSKDGVQKVNALKGPSILLNTHGKGVLKTDESSFDLFPGAVYFIGANTSFALKASSDKLACCIAFNEGKKGKVVDSKSAKSQPCPTQ